MVSFYSDLIPYLVSFTITLSVGIYTLSRRDQKGALTYSGVLFFELLWIVGFIFELISETLKWKLFWDDFQFIGSYGTVFMALFFTLKFVNIDCKRFKKILIFLVVFQVVMIIFVFTDKYNGLIRQKNSSVLILTDTYSYLLYDYGVLMWVTAGYIYINIIIDLILLIRYALSQRKRIYRIQTYFITFSFFLPYLLSIFSSFGLIIFNLRDLSPFLFGVSNALLFFGLFFFHLFDITPIARALILEQMVEGVCIFDVQGRLVDINLSMEKILQAKDSKVIGIKAQTLFENWPEMQNFLRNEKEHDEIPYFNNNGNNAENANKSGEKIFDVRKIRIYDKTQFGKDYSGLFLVFQDITEKKRAQQTIQDARDKYERKFRDKKKELEKINDQLRHAQKMENLGRLAGGIAHDFNNILTSIIGNVELALFDCDESNPNFEYLKEIQNASQTASRLTSQLLTFSRKKIIESKLFNPNSLIEKQSKLLKRLIGENINLELNLEENIGFIKADPSIIEQIILNLVVNARDAMPHGGNLKIETKNLEIDEIFCKSKIHAKPGDYILLSVSDNGTGIPKEIQQHIFEPFFTTKDPNQGTGLGLAVVYGAVNQSKGFIDFYSEENKGTIFKIYLPRIYKGENDESIKNEKNRISQYYKGTETILYVEDNDSVRKAIEKSLIQLGYNVISCVNGKIALQEFKKRGEIFDLLITDVIMPEMGGEELVKQIKRFNPKTKIIYTSGYTDDFITTQGIINSNCHFISKPFTLTKIGEKVRSVLDEKEEEEDKNCF